jgi:hypothetical protein
VNWSVLDAFASWLDKQLVGLLEQWDDRPRVIPPTGAARRSAPIVVQPTLLTVVGPGRVDNQGRFGIPTIGPEPDLVIEPAPRAVWDDLGWERRLHGDQTVYEGHYAVKAPGGRIWFPGRIVERRGKVSAYIADPPPAIKRHPKGPCFQLTEPPWFKVHWHRPAKDPDDAILYVQRILHEVLN